MNMEINPIQTSVSESTRDVILNLLHGPFGPFSSPNQSEQNAIACMQRPMPKFLLKTGKKWRAVQQAQASAACPNI